MMKRPPRDPGGPPAPPRRRNEWLTPLWGSAVWRLVLAGVADHLEADALWDTSAGSGRAITELESGDRSRRLRRALEDHRRPVERPGARFGKWLMDWQCFTDLIVELPPAVWERDLRETGGAGVRVLAQNLEWLHAQAFRKSAPAGRPARALVRPGPGLAADRVEALFGPGVWLPDLSEPPAFRLLPALDDAPLELAPLRLRGESGLEERPPGFYADQRRLLLTPQGLGPLPVPGWRAPPDHYLLLARTGENDWQAFGPQTARVRAWRVPAGAWMFELAPGLGQTGQVLTLELRPQAVSAPAAAGATLMPGLAPAVSPYRLEMEAVALPDLAPGLRRWTLWLEAGGNLAEPERVARDRSALVALSLDARGLSLRDPEGTVRALGERVAAETPIGAGGACLLPCRLPGLRGLLRLARPVASGTPSARQVVLGRTDPADPAAAPAITLDGLAQPGGLLWDGPDPGHTLGNLGLSRSHARVWVEDGRLLADPVAPTCRLIHLDPDRQPRPLPDPAAGAGSLRLEPGDGLLAGLFLLRLRVEGGR